MKETDVLEFRTSLSGAVIRKIGRFDARQTVVLALSREQAELIEDRLKLCGTETGCAACACGRDILEQIGHQREELGPREAD